jgi:hypothetical protein
MTPDRGPAPAARPGRIAAAVLAVAGLLPAGCGAEAAPPACAPAVSTGPLPAWARAGFSDDGSGVPHVPGRGDAILAVLFGAPLRAPPAAGRSNKILWVSRLPVTPGDPLRITARQDGGGTAEREVTGGPGPSVVDLPAPGCWRLTLSWSGHTDTLDLDYARPSRMAR